MENKVQEKKTNPKQDALIGKSVSNYFAEIDTLMKNTAEDVETAEDSCGSWREGEAGW